MAAVRAVRLAHPVTQPQQQAAQQPQAQPQNDGALVKLLAGILAANALLGAAGLPLAAITALARAGISPLVSQRVDAQTAGMGSTYTVALRLLTTNPDGAQLADQIATEPAYRARYLLAASRRVQAAVDAGTPLVDALDAEKRFGAQHEQAQANRRAAAKAVADAAKSTGSLLGWHLGDRKTHTADCLAAAGHNFRADTQPQIGWPGSVHLHCGCQPGPPFASRINVDDATRAFWPSAAAA